MTSRVLIIVGMHRSGTSLITQWLMRCGLFIGERLCPANAGNVEGYYEDCDFLELHEQFLSKRKYHSTGLIDKPVQLQLSEKRQLNDLIERKNRDHMEWGWKEPRTCLFLNVYKELIPSAVYLVIVRDYQTTVSSLLSREYKSHIARFKTKKGLSRLKWILFKKKKPGDIFKKHATHYLEVWIHYYEQIFRHVRTLPPDRYMFLHYTWLIKNDRAVFDRLKNEWRLSLAYLPFNEVFKRELLSELNDIEKYIPDKALIEKAKKIERAMCEFAVY